MLLERDFLSTLFAEPERLLLRECDFLSPLLAEPERLRLLDFEWRDGLPELDLFEFTLALRAGDFGFELIDLERLRDFRISWSGLWIDVFMSGKFVKKEQ